MVRLVQSRELARHLHLPVGTGQYGSQFRCSFHRWARGVCGGGRLGDALEECPPILEGNIRNGPPVAGRLEKETVKATPSPLEFAFAETLPWTPPFGFAGFKNSLDGRTAT